MELKKPGTQSVVPLKAAPPRNVTGRVAKNIRLLQTGDPEPKPDRRDLPDLRPWDSFFVWMLLSSLVVVLPFVVLATAFNLAQRGLWLEIAAALGLIATLSVSTWLAARPVLALSRAAASVGSGDMSARTVPGGGGETRRLALTFNALLDRLVMEIPRLRGEASASAGRLSVSAERLTASTAEQSQAAAQTSAELESLATSSASIAESVAAVVDQAGELRANIQRAQTDLQGSTDRTLANARRVNEIQGVLELLNDIADQTALLALNAAIEAARAGDTGRGFAVVADEVRRLAERSKAAAARIAKLTEGAQATSSEAVLAIERRGQQLDRWMSLTQQMSEVSGKVAPAVQKQQAAAASVKLAIELIADRSRAVAAAAQEAASTAVAQAELAAKIDARGLERD